MKGFTLIELAICIALVGIGALIAGSLGRDLRVEAARVAHRERALEVLEYEASLELERKPESLQTRARLLAELPSGHFIRIRTADGIRLGVSWLEPPRRIQSRELLLVGAR